MAERKILLTPGNVGTADYDPSIHCAICLEKGSKLRKVTSGKDGMGKIRQVNFVNIRIPT